MIKQMDAQPARRRGRPSGQFAESRRRVFRFLVEHEPYRGSNEDLGAAMDCSARQAQRYLTSLQDLEVIEVKVVRHALAQGWKNTRTIHTLRSEI